MTYLQKSAIGLTGLGEVSVSTRPAQKRSLGKSVPKRRQLKGKAPRTGDYKMLDLSFPSGNEPGPATSGRATPRSRKFKGPEVPPSEPLQPNGNLALGDPMSKKTSKRTGIVANARNESTRFAMLKLFLQLAKSAVELLTAIAKYLSV